MKRKILIPMERDREEDRIEEVREETRRLEEEIARTERLNEAMRERHAAQERLDSVRAREQARNERQGLMSLVSNPNQREPDTPMLRLGRFEQPPTPPEPWSILTKEEPKVELQKVDTAKFVLYWENSSSVEEFVERYEDNLNIEMAKGLSDVIRSVERLPLRELPDKRPTVTRSSRVRNFS